jgi:glycosyltransferase involved in cell wall biosynthesis
METDYCVILPTYNNAGTLDKVIRDILKITGNLIIVDDGSTDDTKNILSGYNFLTVISYEKNRGKGYAIKKGFEAALDKGHSCAITIDSDGQHFPEDILTLAARAEEKPDSLIVGARNLAPENLSKGSSFANRFSNFWYRVLTGIKLPDTQTGFRLYPVKLLAGMKFYTNRYEFELEVLVRTAWKGINVESVPVSVFYPSRKERISHFRPFMDFARISLLNMLLVFIAFLYVKPFYFLKYLKRENRREFINKYILKSGESNINISLAIALGIFTGILPIWGFQLLTAIALAHIFRLSKLITAVAANISIPPMIPLILYLSYVTGGIVMRSKNIIRFDSGLTIKSFQNNFMQYLVGSITLAVVMAVIAALLSYAILNLVRRKNKS